MKLGFSKELCTPAFLYLVISLIAILIAIFNKVHLVAILSKTLFIFIWTFLLNLLCKNGYKSVSWFLALLPYILMLPVLFMSFSNETEGFFAPAPATKAAAPATKAAAPATKAAAPATKAAPIVATAPVVVPISELQSKANSAAKAAETAKKNSDDAKKAATDADKAAKILEKNTDDISKALNKEGIEFSKLSIAAVRAIKVAEAQEDVVTKLKDQLNTATKNSSDSRKNAGNLATKAASVELAATSAQTASADAAAALAKATKK